MSSDETSVRSVHPTFDDTTNRLAILPYLTGGVLQRPAVPHRETETVLAGTLVSWSESNIR